MKQHAGKAVFAVFMAACLTLSLAACGTTSSSTDTADEDASQSSALEEQADASAADDALSDADAEADEDTGAYSGAADETDAGEADSALDEEDSGAYAADDPSGLSDPADSSAE